MGRNARGFVWHKCQWHAWRGLAHGSPVNLYTLIGISQLPRTKWWRCKRSIADAKR